jgi:hypothetical protein
LHADKITMKYKLGDFVRFVDEKMEGFVTRIIDDQMIGVTGEDEFEIPVLASKVTTVHGYEPAGVKKAAVAEEQPVDLSQFETKGVFVGVVADIKAPSVVHFHLVNTTSFQLLAVLSTEKQQAFKGEFSGVIAPKSSERMYSAQLADLQLWPTFTFQVLYFTKQNIEQPAPLVVKEKFKAKDFSTTKKQVPVLNQPGWLIRLDEPDLVIDAQSLRKAFLNPPKRK